MRNMKRENWFCDGTGIEVGRIIDGTDNNLGS